MSVWLVGSALTADIFRDTLPNAIGEGGGLGLIQDPVTGAIGQGAISRSVVERAHNAGVFASGSSVALDGVVVRDTSPSTKGLSGRGVVALKDPATGAGASLSVRHTLVERNHDMGIFIAGSEALVEATIVRDTFGLAVDGWEGGGVAAQDDSGTRSRLEVRNTLIERSPRVGLLIEASDATIEATAIRDTTLSALGRGGHGVAIQSDATTLGQADATLRRLLVEGSTQVGNGLRVTARFALGQRIRRDHRDDAERRRAAK